MKKNVTAVLLLLLIVQAAGAFAYQFFPTEGVLRVNAYLREKPSTDSRKILTVLEGTTVTITEMVNNNWMRVEYGKSKGYIRGDLFYDTTTASTGNKETDQSKSGDKMSSWLPGVLLKFGSRGDAVSQLQEGLRTLNFNNLTVNGIFDANTESMVKAFQSSCGLNADGIVGNQTRNALNDALDYYLQMNR